MTAIVHLMLPPFVPDVAIHVDSLEIYMYQAHSQGEIPPSLPPVRCLKLPPLLVMVHVLIKMHQARRCLAFRIWPPLPALSYLGPRINAFRSINRFPPPPPRLTSWLRACLYVLTLRYITVTQPFSLLRT